jgi:TPP-dependent pyruvate/acetoin dehydrogenase alpha subunit
MATPTRKRSDASPRKKTVSKPSTAAAPAKLANGNGTSPSSGEVLRQLYFALLKCRMVAEYVQRQLPSANYDFAIGHEAVVVATTFRLRAEDTITASGANLAARVGAAAPLQNSLAQGDTNNSCGSGLGAVVTPASLSNDPFNLGTGVALVHKVERKGNVVIALCTEESPALDRWGEALKFAGTHKLPILYVIKSRASDPACSGPQNEHLDDFSFMARDYGFPGIIVDGRDVVAVWRVAQESLHRARNDSGPTLIDCTMESAKDPLAQMEHYMRKRSVWDDGWKKRISRQIQAEIDAAVAEPAAKA